MEIRVPWLDQTIWFVPGGLEMQVLLSRGIHRGRLWTAGELSELWKMFSREPGEAAKLGRLKSGFDGELLSVEPLEGGEQ